MTSIFTTVPSIKEAPVFHRDGQLLLVFKRGFRLLLLSVFLWQGCSGTQTQDVDFYRERPAREVRFFRELDAAVAAGGVRDASSFPVSGFPYLRTTRFLTAIEDRITIDSEIEFWLAEMNRLGIEARRKEINNLPQSSLHALAGRIRSLPNRTAMISEMLGSASQLEAYDRSQPGFIEKVRRSVRVPDEYSTPMRIFGLYAIVAVPVTVAAWNANQKFRKWYQTPLEDLLVEGQLIVSVPETGSGYTDKDLSQIFSSSRRNSLGLPDLNGQDIYALVHKYAPVVTQDVVADYDRFGEVEWQNNRVIINPLRATVYYYLTYSFVDQSPVLQINYAFWYSERSGKKSPAYEKGPLDGITVRVSLDQAGQPVMVDVMNSCGCYHFYSPRKGRVEIKKPTSQALYPFVATWLPERYPALPLTLRVNSGWHQIEHLYAVTSPAESESYRLLPYEILESLPHADGQTESVFDSDGIMKNSRRIEPYILFSMGIPRIGYMRQRGHHAIHIVGRAHFTDPEIFDRYFRFR
jgi:hypothetical protein